MNNKTSTPPRRVIRIVLTGGVAAGKSRMLEILRERLRDCGMPAAYVKECATELLERGYTPERWGNVAFQHTVFRHQLENENRAFRRMLPKSRETGRPVLLICDRGLGDGGAYLPPETFGTICRSFGYSRKRLLGRYQGVLFLDSMATRADLPFDVHSGNSLRLETGREDALLTGERSFAAWSDHPNLIRIPAAERFEEKAAQTLDALQNMLRRMQV
ncbi:MAG: AAA family ATPase [Clostridia bacterium]|nr:AAA family ATPase [Clostridia bacterium]